MGRSRTSRLIGDPVEAVEYVQESRERLNAMILPIAKGIGWVGLVGVAVCGLLWVVAANLSSWPKEVPFSASSLPMVTVLCMIAASLLGWGCMQEGLGGLRRWFGWRVGGWLFVMLPLVCGGIGLACAEGWTTINDWPKSWKLFVQWYPPCLMATGVLLFINNRMRDDDEDQLRRGVVWAIPVLPYALLLAVLTFGVDAPGVNGHLAATLQEIGSSAIVIQVALAYFLSGGE